MGDNPSSSTPFTVFDYIGLGLILEPCSVLVGAVMKGEQLNVYKALYAIPFIALGAAFIWTGRNWSTLQRFFSEGFRNIVSAASRSYLTLVILTVAFSAGFTTLPLLVWPPKQNIVTPVAPKAIQDDADLIAENLKLKNYLSAAKSREDNRLSSLATLASQDSTQVDTLQKQVNAFRESEAKLRSELAASSAKTASLYACLTLKTDKILENALESRTQLNESYEQPYRKLVDETIKSGLIPRGFHVPTFIPKCKLAVSLKDYSSNFSHFLELVAKANQCELGVDLPAKLPPPSDADAAELDHHEKDIPKPNFITLRYPQAKDVLNLKHTLQVTSSGVERPEADAKIAELNSQTADSLFVALQECGLDARRSHEIEGIDGNPADKWTIYVDLGTILP